MRQRPSTSSLRLVRRLALCGALAAASLAATAVPSAGAAVSGETNLTVVSKGNASQSLRKQGVKMRAIRPATLRRGRLAVPVSRLASGRTTAVLHRGGLVLQRGTRRVALRGLEARIGQRRTVVARVGGRRMTLLTIQRGRVTARTSDTVRLVGGTAVMTRKAARVIKSRLRLRRLPVGALGRSGLSARSDDAAPGQPGGPAPSEPPRVVNPPAQPTCGDGGAVAPASGSTSWVGSGEREDNSLKSWIDYILTFTEPPPSPASDAQVNASQGATRITESNPYDYRLPITGAATSATGVRTIQHGGRIQYVKPKHGIDNQIANLRMVIAADGQSGCVVADGRYQAGGGIGTSGRGQVDYLQQHVLDLTPLAGTTSTWVATIAPEGEEEMPPYDTGAPWGRFTIAPVGP